MKKLILGSLICMFAVVLFSSCEKEEIVQPKEDSFGTDLAGSVQLTGNNVIAKKGHKYPFKAGSDLAGSVQ